MWFSKFDHVERGVCGLRPWPTPFLEFVVVSHDQGP
jgi:hypothetical protein